MGYNALYQSLHDCGNQHCNSKGSCSIRDNVWDLASIGAWSGNFEDLWDVNSRCWCDPDRSGAHCEFGVACSEDSHCSSEDECKEDKQCYECSTFENPAAAANGAPSGLC